MFRIDGSDVVVDMGKNVSGNGSMMFKTENLIKSDFYRKELTVHFYHL